MHEKNTKLRKISFILAGTLLFIVILNSLLGLFRFPFVHSSPFEAISSEAAFILDTKVGESIQSTELGNLFDFDALQQLEKDQAFFAQLFEDSTVNHAVHHLAAFQKVSADQVDFLHVFDVKNLETDSLLLNYSVDGKFIKDFVFEGQPYHILETIDQEQFTVYRFRNLLLLSRYPTLMEDGIRKLQSFSSSISHQKTFKRIVRKAPESRCNLHVNLKALPAFFGSFFKSNYRSVLSAIAGEKSWLSLNLITSDPSENIGLFYNKQAVRYTNKETDWSVYECMPDQTGFLMAQQHVKAKIEADSFYQRYMAPWATGVWALGIINAHTSADRLLVLEAQNAEYLEHYIERYQEEHGALESFVYQTYPIERLLDNQLLQPWIQDLQLNLENPYYTILDNNIIFASSGQAIEVVIDKYITGQTLATNTEFLGYINELSEDAKSLLFMDGAAVLAIIHHMLDDQTKEAFQLAKHNLANWFGGFSFYKKSNTTFLKKHMQPKEKKEGKTDILWRVALKEKLIGTPKPIWNASKGTYDILVQDAANRLYMINDRGEVLWKRAFEEPILSEVFMMKTASDRATQLLFNTAKNIYLVDLSGENTGNFPLKLQSPATNGLTLVDFKRNKRYQFFLACANGYAYGFTKDGNPVLGWNPRIGVGSVEQPFQHFQTRNRDYLLVLDQKGKLAAYDRTGRRAFSQINLGTSFKTTPTILNTGNESVIALVDETGTMKMLNRNGKSFPNNFNRKNKESVKVSFAKGHQRQANNVLILDKNKVTIHRQNGTRSKKIFEIILPDAPDEVFEIDPIGMNSKNFLGTLNLKAKQINLLNNQGKQPTGFPLAGTTAFTMVDLFGGNYPILLVGYENALYAYQIGSILPENVAANAVLTKN